MGSLLMLLPRIIFIKVLPEALTIFWRPTIGGDFIILYMGHSDMRAWIAVMFTSLRNEAVVAEQGDSHMNRQRPLYWRRVQKPW